jgi:hypothetical protein
MIDSIKITSLTNIGANLSYTSIFPVVNVTGTPITNKANLQIIGNYILSQAGSANMVQAAQANLAQSVVNSAQPNITSVGTLSISTLKISGGTSGYILRTDGSGNLTWISPTATVSGSNSQVQFNNAGSFGSSANFTYDNSNNILNVIRANASYLTAYESVSTANLSANGLATIARINVTNTANLGAVGNVTITGGSNGQVLTTNGNGVLSWTNDANSSYGNSNVVTLLSAFGSNTITTTGNVSVGNIIGNGQALTNIAGANVSGFVPNANVANTAFAVAAANVSGLGNIATVNLTGSNANVLYGNGVFAAVAGGANTGNVTFSDQVVMGTGSNDGTGGLYLAPGNASIANSAVQYLRVRGGDVVTHIHLDTGNNAYYDQYFGADSRYVKLEANGNVVINANDYAGNGATWNFGVDGTLTLPNDANIATIGNITQFNSCPNGFLGLNTYDAGSNNIARVNISSTDGLVSIGISDPITEIDYNWFFSNGGNLTLPGNLVIAGNTSVFGTNASLIQTTDNRPLLALSSGANGAVSSLWVEDIGNVGTSNIAAVYANPTSGSKIVRIAVGQNGSNTGPNLWDFGTDGNLTLPGDVVGPANANLTIYANAGVHTFTFADDGTFYAPDNVVLGGTTISVGPNANTLNLANSTLVISSTSNAYIQAVINNVSDNGSADWVAQGHLGNDDGGWVDLGFTSSFYSDPDYTITGPGDGYVFTQAYLPGQAPATGNGSLILATGENGGERDIIFGTGGFLTANIFGRISHANNALELSRANSNINLSGGGNIINANVISANSFSGNGGGLSNVATSTTGNWTLAPGVNTVNISVPLNGTYSIWVRGNIPNGIVTYTATAVVTNNNVPVLGSSYGWYYEDGNALVLTSIPTQFVGTVNNISNASISTTTANVFTFGITNNSGNAAVVNWGYTKL